MDCRQEFSYAREGGSGAGGMQGRLIIGVLDIAADGHGDDRSSR